MRTSQAMNRVMVALFALGVAAIAAAGGPEDGGPRGDGPGADQGCRRDGHAGPAAPPPGMPGFIGAFGDDRPPPYLMGLKLSEEQQDKVFSIVHAASPEWREQMKAARKAREALHDLGESNTFDDGKAAALAQAAATAEGKLSLLHARADHDIFTVLTSEQRAQIAERRRERDAHSGNHAAGEPPPR